MLLSLPITRTRFVVEKFLAFVPVIVAINVVTFVAIYAGIVLVDETIDVGDMAALHGVSALYLLAQASVGLLASVVFGTFLVDSFTYDTEYDWLGAVSASRHFDPAAILVAGDGDPAGAVVLAALVAASAVVFERRDV